MSIAVAQANGGVTLGNVETINYLLWHKAVQGVDEDNDRINQYLALLKDGEHVGIKDDFDRGIALAFELVVQAQLNPWKIDLVRFSQMYLQRAREAKIDLVVAGRLILMAWTVLKLQSDDLVRKFEARQQETQDLEWDQIDHGWEMTGGDFEFTQAVLARRQPIDEKIWHEGDRPVTLIELVDAFEQARTEAEARTRLTEEREKYKQMLKAEGVARFQGRVHKEDLEEDIKLVWQRILGFNGTDILLSQLYDKTDVWDFVTAFNSVLFLHRDRRIQLTQDDFPYGPVKLRNIAAEKRAGEDAAPTRIMEVDAEKDDEEPKEAPTA